MLFHDGRLQDGPVRFDLSDRGLLLGDGLFETMAMAHGRIFRRDDHLDRMASAAATLAIPVDRARLLEPLEALAHASAGTPQVVRLTLTRGPAARGLRLPADPRPTIFASTAPWAPRAALPAIRLAVSTIRRNATSPLSRMKSLNYLDNVLALEEAVRKGADDALILSTAGGVACTSAANVFAIRDGSLVTPPIEEGVLPGITRALVLELAAGLGLVAREEPLTRDDLVAADGVFTTNSVALVTEVIAIDGRPVATRARDRIVAARAAVWGAMAEECGPLSA